MRSAINHVGTLDNQRTAVVVSGPIHGWDIGDRKADFWVRIVQGEVVAEGRSYNWKFERKHERWEVKAKVSDEGKLKRGRAYAEYWARVRRASGPAEDVYWPVWPIELK